MLFNSLGFCIFLPTVFSMYWFVFNKSLKQQNLLLLFASYFFYSCWSWQFAGLLLLSTLLDYFYGFQVNSPNPKKAKLFLWLSVINNLGILGAFKYFNFFSEQFHEGLTLLGFNVDPVLLDIALPVGISFYTFHGMSYVFDIHRGHQRPVNNFIDYGVFVSFFPLLVAGPIERASHLLPQIQKSRIFDYGVATEGTKQIILGFFKKIVIADSIAPLVDLAFDNPEHYSSLSLIFAAIGFSFQIYCDFSGYSDIALGVGKLSGIHLLVNFKLPYFSRNITEFWKRWHISLSSWFRDYLYIPLGGSRMGLSKTIRNTMVIFLVSGFWHGANWTFIFWGFLHGVAFLPNLIMNWSKKTKVGIIRDAKDEFTVIMLFQTLATFLFVTTAWVFFRADDLPSAFRFFNSIAELDIQSFNLISSNTHLIMLIKFIIGLFTLILIEWVYLRKEIRLPNFSIWVMLTMLIFLGSYTNSVQFIYFQF